jgi:uncharacterized protein
VPAGTSVDTVTASTALMVYNWPVDSDRYRRVARFVDALFGKLEQLQQPPRHAKWRDTLPTATIPGLQRFKAAQDWLDGARSTTSGPNAASMSPEEFRSFVSQSNVRMNMSTEEAAKLYDDFVKWRRAKGQR